MGPIIIFDKSTLQSLSLNEAVFLDHLFLTNITPLFFVEIIADLEKETKTGKTPDQVVGELAFKTPDYSSKPNIYHKTLLAGELMGEAKIDMQYGRPHIGGGREVSLGNETGVLFDEAPEEQTLKRWYRRQFRELERQFAKAWRNSLSNINFEEKYKEFQSWYTFFDKPKSLNELKKLVDHIVNNTDQENILRHGLTLIDTPEYSKKLVIDRWYKSGKPAISEFAPYFTHVISVDLFFYLAIAADLIGRERPSNKIDIAYLYYLPFCMVFTSSDNLHARVAPFFLRSNQTFIKGNELKQDLSRIEAYFDKLPDEIKKKGLVYFASQPPIEGNFLTSSLWDKHMSPSWRENLRKLEPQPNSEATQRIMEKIKRFQKEAKPISENIRPRSGEPDQMVIRRVVQAQKGKWKRFPDEVLNRRKNEKGEWEDIRPKPPEQI